MGVLDAKVVIVTGSDGFGIGSATVWEAAKEGALVAGCGMDAERGRALIAQLRAARFQAIFVPADLRDEHDAAHVVQQALHEFGRVDCLINNAALARRDDRDVQDTPPDVIEAAFRDNFMPAYNCARQVLPHMCEQRHGAIVNVSSVNADAGGYGQIGYSAAKCAIAALTRHISTVYGYAVRCNAPVLSTVPNGSPNWDDRECRMPSLKPALAAFNPSKRLPSPDEIARILVWLVSDESAYISGVTLPVDGGLLAQKVPFHGGDWRSEACRMHEAIAQSDNLAFDTSGSLETANHPIGARP